MISISPYIVFMSITIIIIVMIMIIYYIRLNHARRQILPYSMRVFVISQPNQEQLHDPQVFWSSSAEQLPPPYSAVIQSINTNSSIVHDNNES